MDFPKTPLEKEYKILQNEPKLASLAFHGTEILKFKK